MNKHRILYLTLIFVGVVAAWVFGAMLRSSHEEKEFRAWAQASSMPENVKVALPQSYVLRFDSMQQFLLVPLRRDVKLSFFLNNGIQESNIQWCSGRKNKVGEWQLKYEEGAYQVNRDVPIVQ